jgi:hypothetical protein
MKLRAFGTVAAIGLLLMVGPAIGQTFRSPSFGFGTNPLPGSGSTAGPRATIVIRCNAGCRHGNGGMTEGEQDAGSAGSGSCVCSESGSGATSCSCTANGPRAAVTTRTASPEPAWGFEASSNVADDGVLIDLLENAAGCADAKARLEAAGGDCELGSAGSPPDALYSCEVPGSPF